MLNFSDKSFSLKKTAQYSLSIQVDLDGFSFCVYEPSQKRLLAIHRIPIDFNVPQDLLPEQVEKVYREFEWLGQPFSSCNCIYFSRKCTLIPVPYFIQDRLRVFLDFVHPLDELDEVHYKLMNGTEAMAVFAVPNLLAAELYVKHRNIQFYNQCVPLIHNVLKHKNGLQLAINLNGGIADFALTQSGSLTFHNSFAINAAPDLPYYTAFVLKQLGIQPGELNIRLSGQFNSEAMILMQAGFAQLSTERISLPIADEATTANFLLLNLHECV